MLRITDDGFCLGQTFIFRAVQPKPQKRAGSAALKRIFTDHLPTNRFANNFKKSQLGLPYLNGWKRNHVRVVFGYYQKCNYHCTFKNKLMV